MTRARLNLFIEPEHAKRLNQLAALKGLSKSSIIAAALASFLSPDGGDQREAASPSDWTVSHGSSTNWSATRTS